MEQEKLLPDVPLTKRLFPSTPKTALQYRNTDPEKFLVNIDSDTAQVIIAEWRNENDKGGTPKAAAKTQAEYQMNHLRLCHAYAKELRIEVDAIDPVQVVRQLFLHSTRLSPAAWRLYRYSLRHIFNQQAKVLQQRGQPHDKLLRALAALITFSKKPYADERGDNYMGKQVRIKSIGLAHFEQLIGELANGADAKSVRVQRAQAFAVATLATGMRPDEWLDTEIRDAKEHDFVDGTNPKGWAALVINTSKRKETEAP